MDASMDSSVTVEETQATQLLQHVLEPNDSSHASNLHFSPERRTQTDYRSSISDESIPKQYNYHGLASTQTESQFDVPMADDEAEGPSATPISPKRSPLQQIKGSKQTAMGFDDKPQQVNKAVSFQSPSPKKVAKVGARNSPHHPPARSTTFPDARVPPSRTLLREESEDSFAGDISVDPAQQFLASSKRFDIPLSELKRLADTSDTTTPAVPSPVHSPMRRRVPPIQPQRFSTPVGKILVESTPSLSGGSQYQLSDDEGPSEAAEAEQIETQLNGNISRQTTEEYLSGSEGPSSSYLANFENKRNEFPMGQSQPEPTQPSTQLATQVETQVEDHSGAQTNNGQPSITDSTTSSKRRAPVSNLLNLVSPSKRHRYQHYVQTATTKATAGSAPNTMHSPKESAEPLASTQPSEDVVTPSKYKPGRSSLEILSLVSETHGNSHASPVQEATQLFEEDSLPPPRRCFPSKSSVHASQRSVSHPPKQSKDVVPDSEPDGEEARVPHPSSPEAPTRNRAPVSARPSRRSLNVDDVVPDSMDMDIDQGESGLEKPEKVVSPTSSDDEAEVPLARNIATRRAEKEKKADISKPVATRKSSRELKKPAEPGKSKAAPAPRKRKGTGALPSSWEDGMVPSSIQNEDQAKSADGRSSRASSRAPKNKGKGKAPATSRPKNHRAKRRRKSTGDTDDEEDSSATESEDDRRTVSDKASTYGGEEDTQATTASQPSRKRKRGNQSKAAPTPVTRQAKRLQTASVSGSKDGTRIFGFWKQDGYWYPGTIISHEGDNWYKVLFDDQAEGILQLEHLRTYTIYVGDTVVPHRYRAPAQVTDVAKFAKSGVISVIADGSPAEVAVQDIKIHKTVIQSAWKDRMITPVSIHPLHAKGTLRSTPSRSSVVTLPADTSRGKWMEHTAVVVTGAVTARNNNNRESSMDSIKRAGGIVLEDWSSVLHMAGKYDATSQRWTIHRSDVHWIGKSNIERVFLLGDQPTAKAKYLLALALGIPCVSFSWLHDKEDDPITRWPAHLLPQGDCEQLSARLSQQVNLLWGTERHDVTQMMENSTAFKLFAKSSVLCIGREVFPQRISSNARLNDAQKQIAYNAVTQIVLAMGADYVEAVPDVKYASRSSSHYDYIVIKKAEEYDSAYRGTTVVLWQWVKDCLIASRKLPLKKWDLQEDEYSQEI